MEYDLRLVMDYMFKVHEGQVRKYTGEPFITHPLVVFGIVRAHGCDNLTQAGALLHDVIEDTDETFYDIVRLFDTRLAALVFELDDTIYEGSRKERQCQIMESWDVGHRSYQAKCIRLADIIHNIESIVCHDRDFARVYLAEKYALLPFLQGGNKTLYAFCAQRLNELLFKLNMVGDM